MNMTIADVVETHRAALGAKRMHVDLAQGATAEALSTGLTQLSDRLDAYGAFREEERLQAQLARRDDLLLKIEAHAREGNLAAIIDLTDGTVDVDLEPDLLRMVANRQSKGESLPSGVEGVTAGLEN